ncbi:MAG: DUF5329 domain-containing protein [Halieaceae bacterium]
MRRALSVMLVLTACLLSPLLAADEQLESEVNYLLEFVAGSGCDFVRNGSSHDPESAADHLRLKYSRGKRYVNNAEQFIDRLASESSWTGKPYSVTCEGQSEPAGPWLHRALDSYRANAASA